MLWIVDDEQTIAGWSPVSLQTAAVIRFADPRIGFACGESGLSSESATAFQLIPPSTSGRYVAPENAQRLPKATKGIEPAVSHWVTTARWAEVRDSSGLSFQSAGSPGTNSTS